MKTKYIFISVVGIIILFIGFKLYTNKQKINQEKELSTQTNTIKIPVIADTVSFEKISIHMRKTGTLYPYKTALIYAQTSGNITKVNFNLGDAVSRGDILVVVDAQKLEIDLENARAKMHRLEQDVKVYEDLLKGGATTQETLNQYQLDYTNAKNQVAQLQKQLDDTKLRAPLSGVVSNKDAELGVFVNSGTELGKIIDISKLKVQLYLSEQEVYHLHQQDEVAISTSVYPDQDFRGQISYISSEGDDTHNYLVEVVFDNSEKFPLKSGTFVTVATQRKEAVEVLTIPRIALLENSNQNQVYVVKNEKVYVRNVQLGDNYGENVSVIKGLEQGDVIVTSGQINLTDQAEVVISKNKIK